MTMNILVLVDQMEDVEKLERLNAYLHSREDVTLIALYITDSKSNLCYGTDAHPHYVLDDAELIYRDELEDRVFRVCRPWHKRVRFRHEIGDRMSMMAKVVCEERIDIIALTRKQYVTGELKQVSCKQIVFDDGEVVQLIAN